MSRSFAIVSWTLLLLVMVCPQRTLGFVDLSSNLLQAALFAAAMIAWASVFSRRAPTRRHSSTAIGVLIPIGVGVLIVGAAVMESVQAFEPNRISSVFDFLINAATVIAVGWICLLLTLPDKTGDDIFREIYGGDRDIF